MATNSKAFFEGSAKSSSLASLLFLGLILIVNIPMIFGRPDLDLPMAFSISPCRLLTETTAKTETNAVAISATSTDKASTFTRKNGGFQAAAHDVPSGPNPESNK
ncbi:hypothetical protein POM88_017954 [Heracleum sosnowskyi]|uniref:Uncharacterized protein n=1 Tax=Heracleum sosnowskyi TaxID=360622 RepID=A0AAD8MYP4_9APIA|nr:hypothetical protein POM88_017954 [Heracleum sosnowskyi]